jgi:hypothetical protein
MEGGLTIAESLEVDVTGRPWGNGQVDLTLDVNMNFEFESEK